MKVDSNGSAVRLKLSAGPLSITWANGSVRGLFPPSFLFYRNLILPFTPTFPPHPATPPVQLALYNYLWSHTPKWIIERNWFKNKTLFPLGRRDWKGRSNCSNTPQMGNLKSWPQWQAVYSRARDVMQIFIKPVKGTTWNSSPVELGKTCCCLTKCTQIPSLSCSLKIKVTSSKAYFKMLFVRINTTKQQQQKTKPPKT